MSRVFRFHGPAERLVDGRPVPLRKRRGRPPERVHILGADTTTISDRDGTRPIETYAAVDAHAVTLTRREADLIALANPGIPAPKALENLHPWLPECRFSNDSRANFRNAEMVLRRFGRHLMSASSFCNEKWNAICNALRQSSRHDARFYAAWHLPIQEALVLEEVRPNRSVVAIDFNGMYSSCIQHDFPKPSALRLVELKYELAQDEKLAAGLYRCILDGPTSDFIIQHNPFRSFHSGRYLRTRLDEPITIDLNEFEISFFRHHFRRVHLVEAVVSDQVVAHPLAREVRRFFARRGNYREQGNKALADREKFLATLMSSCASRSSRSLRKFATREEALVEVKALYGIDIPADEPVSASDIWLEGRRGVAVRYGNAGVEMQGPMLHDGSACHLLGQRTVARGRIMILKMMERILAAAPQVQICYANIDSIHFSLPTVYLDDTIAWLQSEASEAMGSFKIEAVTQHGLWLEPGRYWLYSDTEVVKFRNRSVGDRQRPFGDHAIHVVSRRIGDLHLPIRAALRMERTMSPSRSVDCAAEDHLIRQSLIEVGDGTTFAHVLDELERNQRQAVPARMKAFANLREKMNASRAAASEREVCARIV